MLRLFASFAMTKEQITLFECYAQAHALLRLDPSYEVARRTLRDVEQQLHAMCWRPGYDPARNRYYCLSFDFCADMQ